MIYFMQSDNYIKIGYSKNKKNVNARLKTLQIGNPRPLKLLVVMEGDKIIERYLHLMFTNYNERGEWFRYDGEVLDSIIKLQNGEIVMLPNTLHEVGWIRLNHLAKYWLLLKHTSQHFSLDERFLLFTILGHMVFTHQTSPRLSDGFINDLYRGDYITQSIFDNLVDRKIITIDKDMNRIGLSMINLTLLIPNKSLGDISFDDVMYGIKLFRGMGTSYFILEHFEDLKGSVARLIKHFNNESDFVYEGIDSLVEANIIEVDYPYSITSYRYTKDSENILDEFGLLNIGYTDDSFDLETILARDR